MYQIDDTHDAGLQSWVESANHPATDFPIQNLPIGVFRRAGSRETFRPGVAIGDHVVDLLAARDAGLLPREVAGSLAGCEHGELNAFMAQGPHARRALRRALSEALRSGSTAQAALQAALLRQADIEHAMPCRVGDYTDFYTGIHHATAVGKLFRPDNPLLPNYKWVPIGYHGRSSSLGVSGQSFLRPQGQTKGTADTPEFGPSKRLDYELELGAFIATGNTLGSPIAMEQAEDHVFGLVLLNDWSARDLQAWEYQPLGPFLAKNFASTISPWIVTMEALAPFRAAWTRAAGDPQPLSYLDSEVNRRQGAIDITLEVWLQTSSMAAAGQAPERLMQSNFRDAYWSVAQMVAHHSVNGCNLQPGDLLGSGTQSGPEDGQGGSLLELTCGGKRPVRLANGETRTFLADGDTVILRAQCQRDGFRRIGFGDCAGTVLPAGKR
ncbi:fumarylacetoacetase [Aquabacterium sp. A7-Y]|uniref:fumarylacetoacetase n=1 Tax=Aquabacterium sp. A7-Y TaxID=1349605 RepID=UPI00223CC5A7|nr:fumarylacetoacetase [Aquabacterium sp. A7-Y]MCW7539017.1 fumarylacetoacetase [Aquabacterium sp. A7-Y]